MSVAAVFASHSPLKDYHEPGDGINERVQHCLGEIRTAVSKFDPDLVIAIGPDHFNGFFYRLMPSFCIGTALESVGDWATPPGAVNVASNDAEQCVVSLNHQNVDVSLSHRMEVDHGFTQVMTQLFDWQAMPPILPVFVNCAAPPLPPLKRVMALGAGIGKYVAEEIAVQERKVLFVASGGLSHDPPIPRLDTAPTPVKERLIAGGTLSPEARQQRQEKVLSDANKQLAGVSEQRELNPIWDKQFLELFSAARFNTLAAQSEAQITQDAGCGGHEIRTWIAARCALDYLNTEKPSINFYETITAWVAGFGVATCGLGVSEKF